MFECGYAAIAALSLDSDSPRQKTSADPTIFGDVRESIEPMWLDALDEPPSVYPEIMPSGDQQGMNSGGVNFGLDVDWLSDYVYRGVDQSTPGRRPESALQFNANAEFDLGKLPHPFIGLFVNVFNSDPISRFEEV